VDFIERVAQAELLDRRRHPGRHRTSHPAALDEERDAASVGPSAGTRTLLAPAQECLDHAMAALVLGHRHNRPERVWIEAPLEHRGA
jgi:hypothetical protein